MTVFGYCTEDEDSKAILMEIHLVANGTDMWFSTLFKWCGI